MTYRPTVWERICVAAAAFIIIALVALLAFRNQHINDPNMVVMLRTLLSLAVATLGATVPGFLNISFNAAGLAVRAGGALALFVLTYVYTPKVIDRPPVPSARVNFYGENLPSELDVSKKEGFTDVSMREGHVMTYRSSAEHGELNIKPYLRYLADQSNGGPILPLWIQGFFFPVPILGVVVNNPTSAPIAVSSIELEIEHRASRADSWLLVSQPRWNRKAPGLVTIDFHDFGWNNFANAVISYDVVPIPESHPGLDPKFTPVHSADALLSVPGIYWDRPYPYIGSASSYKNNDVVGASVKFPLAEKAIEDVREGQSTAVIFGQLVTTNTAGQRKSYRFATRLFLSWPAGPGRINPSYKYTVEIEPDGPPIVVPIGVAHEVDSGKQDYFLIGVFTVKPADVRMRVRVALSSGEVVDAGMVNLQTFFPKHYGLGGEPERYGKSFVRVPKEDALSTTGH